MFPTVLTELKSYLGRDYVLGLFFPLLTFFGSSLVLYFEIAMGLGKALAAWDATGLTTQGLLVVSLLAITTFVSYLVYNLQYTITRVFEGYWSRMPLLGWLRESRIALYRQRWDYLDAQARESTSETDSQGFTAEQLAYYPPPNHLDWIMPTRIGNILRASEIYAYDRYGIDSAVIWTRLRPLLGTEQVSALENAQIARDFMLFITLLALTFSLIWCPVLVLFTNRWDLVLVSALGIPLAWLAYENAVQSAIGYGEHVKVVFDLYRFELLKALHRPLPAASDAERKEWLRLNRFFYRNAPLPPSAPPAAAQKGWDRLADSLADYIDRIDPAGKPGDPQP